MKSLILACLAVMFCSLVPAAEERSLPEPKKSGGVSVLEAIDIRGSAPGTGFPKGKLSDDDLATILWAMTGKNRDGGKWTVPMAMGRKPYCKVYVATKEGAYLYDWERHVLLTVAEENISPKIAIQAFSQMAPVNLIIVGDSAEFADMTGPFVAEFGVVLAGAMSEHVYLAAEAMGVGARLIYSINREETSRLLQLAPEDKPYFAISLGKR